MYYVSHFPPLQLHRDSLQVVVFVRQQVPFSEHTARSFDGPRVAFCMKFVQRET